MLVCVVCVLQVRVYLRDMEGLPAFTEVWNSWVDHTSLPVSAWGATTRAA